MDRIVRGVRGEMAGHDHLSRNCLGEGGDGKLGWMKIAEEARDHLSGRNWSARLRFWSCWDTFAAEERKQEGRKEGIGERTCGRHVSWKRTARMMNLSRGRPRCTTLAGLLLAHRFPFLENIFHRLFVSRERRRSRADLPSKFPFSSPVVNTELRHRGIVGKFFSRGSLPDASMELGDKQKTR